MFDTVGDTKVAVSEAWLLGKLNGALAQIAAADTPPCTITALRPADLPDRNWTVARFDSTPVEESRNLCRLEKMARVLLASAIVYDVAWHSATLQ